MNKRTIAMIFAGLIVLAIAFFLFNNKNKQNEFEPDTELVTDQSGTEDMVKNATNEDCEDCPETTKVGISITGDEIINLYAENAELRAQLTACMEGKESTTVVAPTRTTTRRTTTTRRPATTQSSETTSSTGTTEKSQVSSPNFAISKYEGVISGDFGATFDGDGKLFYYIKNGDQSKLSSIKNRSTTETHLNGKFGALGVQVGDYLIYKTKRDVTPEMLNSKFDADDNDNPLRFAIYIGDHTQYSYDMWLPHEFVKLNESLANSPGIRANDQGGFNYVADKINYKSK